MKKEINLYLLYQYNLWFLINTYKLKYYWIKLSEEKFYNGVKGQLAYNWSFQYNNPWLNKYKKNKIDLAKDILKNGTFTPIFYQKIDNKKYVIIGKHRLYSLLFYNIFIPIEKNFLFIELPNRQNPIELIQQELIQFDENKQIKKIMPNSLIEICFLLFKTGDALTPYLWDNNCIPFLPFNDEKQFKEWLNTPIEELYGDIDI